MKNLSVSLMKLQFFLCGVLICCVLSGAAHAITDPAGIRCNNNSGNTCTAKDGSRGQLQCTQTSTGCGGCKTPCYSCNCVTSSIAPCSSVTTNCTTPVAIPVGSYCSGQCQSIKQLPTITNGTYNCSTPTTICNATAPCPPTAGYDAACSGSKAPNTSPDSNGCACNKTCNPVSSPGAPAGSFIYQSNCTKGAAVCMGYASVTPCTPTSCPTTSTSTAPAGTSGWTGVDACQRTKAGSTSNCVQSCQKDGPVVYTSWTPPAGQGWQTTACTPTSCNPAVSNDRSTMQAACRKAGTQLDASTCAYYPSPLVSVTSGGTTWYQCNPSQMVKVVTYSCR